VFHLATTALFREYSPGVATALGMLPASVFRLRQLRSDDVLSDEAVGVGLVLSSAAVPSLFIDMPRLGGPALT
jgi:hypothetical protein